MSNGIKFIFAFGLGVVAGSVATCKYFKTKYETIAQEEIDSVKEVYSRKNKPEEDTSHKIIIDKINEYKDMVGNLNYSNIKEKGGSESMEKCSIEVVPPDEFGENDEYDLISITYYANGVLTDDGDYPIEDVEDTVGPDALNSFGEYEDDTVYVRNDDRKCYYEICRDNSNYIDYDPQDVDE